MDAWSGYCLEEAVTCEEWMHGTLARTQIEGNAGISGTNGRPWRVLAAADGCFPGSRKGAGCNPSSAGDGIGLAYTQYTDTHAHNVLCSIKATQRCTGCACCCGCPAAVLLRHYLANKRWNIRATCPCSKGSTTTQPLLLEVLVGHCSAASNPADASALLQSTLLTYRSQPNIPGAGGCQPKRGNRGPQTRRLISVKGAVLTRRRDPTTTITMTTTCCP